ncbi:SRPBCC family protein [Natrialbaceae archaeon GCM10025810]|uniref:SRPBCC family protein n=1 Tax=Halovalidus salilacus TaxID=3075124 RepID=UPI00361838F5
MRTVERSRFVRASPEELERWLEPTRIVEAEGSFTARTVEDVGGPESVEGAGESGPVEPVDESVLEPDDGEATIVLASGPGLEFPLLFEDRDAAIYYAQAGDRGPFAHMETWIEHERENEGSRVAVRSTVELAAPIPFGDRIAAWKRTGEVERLLDALEEKFA